MVRDVLSDDGTLLYISASSARRAEIIDAQGKVLSTLPPGRSYSGPAWSPDGTRIATSILDASGHYDLWVYDLASTVLSRLTQLDGVHAPAWSPDGKRIAFVNAQGNSNTVMWMPSDGSTPPADVPGTAALDTRRPSRLEFTHDGRFLLVQMAVPLAPQTTATPQVYAVPLAGGPAVPLLESTDGRAAISISPDDKWLAYASNETGRSEVYVAPFAARGGRVQITSNGGNSPSWAKDGRHLFVRSTDTLSVATLDVGGAIPRVVSFANAFERPLGNLSASAFGVSPDSKRVVVVRSAMEDARITVVTNWMTEVKAKMGEHRR